MKLRKVRLGFMLIILAVILSGSTAKKPKILIIGDSISIGYTPYVVNHFKERAIVMRNPGNANDTGKGLKTIREYIGDEDWDIIQFNWGLHDLCYRHPDSKSAGNRDKVNGKITFEVDEYARNLDSLVRTMKELSDARLVFVTTSYVPENEPGRFVKDPVIYNKAAKKVMKKHSVLINDIYKKSKPIHKAYGMGNDDVHFSDKGNEQMSKLIIEFLEKEIGKEWND